MIRATRRAALAGALALPAATSLAKSPKRQPSGTILLHDPSLEAGRRFAAMAEARGDKALAMEGDRIHFGRAVFERAPALVIGVSRAADALLIEEVGREAGYEPIAADAVMDKFVEGRMSSGGKPLGWVLASRVRSSG